MKLIRKLRPLLFSTIICYSCSSPEKTKDIPSLHFVGSRASQPVEDGQIVTFNMCYKNKDKQVIADTRLMDGPVTIVCNDSIWQQSGLFYQALKQMGSGDSANFNIPAVNFYEKSGQELPPILNKEDSLYFQVKIENIK